MRHENRYFFAHLFGFAGLTVDETIHSIDGWLHGFQMPYLMPRVWYVSAGIALAVGFGIGVGIAVNTLMLRGLM